MTILIVEDEESIREVQKAYLSRSGYTILEAEDGEEALSIFKKNKLDLVLLDLNLPIKNGIDVLLYIFIFIFTSQVLLFSYEELI